MSGRPDVVIFVEHVARELDLACLYAMLLERDHGLRAAVRSIPYGLEETLAGEPPAIVALPYAYAATDYGTRDILAAWPGARYVNLGLEQIFLDIQKPFKAPRDAFARDLVLHLAWGGESSRFKKDNGVSRVAITGCPVHSLYRTPWREFYGEPRPLIARRHGLDDGRKWLLIPENYGVAFHKNAHLYAKGAISRTQADRFQQVMDQSFEDVTAWWHSLARRGDCEVIVRPRPAVPAEAFTELVKRQCGDLPEHLHIIKEGTVREWILASDAVASSYSTTIIEACVAGKRACSMEPRELPPYCRSSWMGHADVVRTEREFVDWVAGSPSADSALGGWAAQELGGDDPPAAICRVLAGLAKGGLELRSPAEAGIETAGGGPFFTAPLAGHEKDAFTQSEVDRLAGAWRAIL